MEEGEFSFADIVADDKSKNESKSFESPTRRSNATQSNFSAMSIKPGLEDKVGAMIGTEYSLTLMPPQCWNGVSGVRSGTTKPFIYDTVSEPILNAISTSFLPCGISIEISSTTDYISIQSLGVVQFRILFCRDGSNNNNTGSGSFGSRSGNEVESKNAGGESRKEKNQIQVKDIQVSAPSISQSAASFSSPGDSWNNNSPSHNNKLFAQPSSTSFRTPWPCCKVEAMIMQRNTDFPSIISVSTYSTSSIRSSAASTPQSKPKKIKGGLY